MLNYINQPCPLCGKHMHEEDDIVVCPVCATPQHRECWMSEGHCVNEALHSPDFVWKPRGEANMGEAPERKKVTCPECGFENPGDAFHCSNCGHLLSTEKADVVCRFCGNENPAGSKLCSRCGAPLIFENKFFENNIYMSGVNMPENEPIGNTTAGEAALYVQSNSRRYLPKFKKISGGKKLSFNFASFIFAPWWFFYRKLYKAGIILLILFSAITFMTYPVAKQLTDIVNEMQGKISVLQEEYKDKTADEAAMKEAYEKETAIANEFTAKGMKPAGKLALVMLAEHLLCGFIANYVYYKKMCSDMEKIKETQGEEIIKKSLIMRVGGVSLISLAAGFLGGEIFNSLLSFIADKIISAL